MKFKTASLGLLGVEYANTGKRLQPWDSMILKDFGAYTAQLGYISDPSLAIEVDEDDVIYDGYVRNPMIELNPEDYKYLTQTGRPYNGMLALGDTGRTYTWDDFGSLFSLLGQVPKKRRRRRRKKRRAAKRRGAAPSVRTVTAKTARALPQVAQMTTGGKAIVSVQGTSPNIAMKLVKPILQAFNYYAKQIAPIAAAFPGYGPVINALAKLPEPGKKPKPSMSSEAMRELARKRAEWLKKQKQIEARRKLAIARRKAAEKKKIEARRKAAIARRKAMEKSQGGGAPVAPVAKVRIPPTGFSTFRTSTMRRF